MTTNRTRAALYLVCISRAGYVDGARLIEFIEDWQRVVREVGGAVTMSEYCEGTDALPMRTAWRRLALFRQTFPQLGSAGLPNDLMEPLLARLATEVDADLAELGVAAR